MWQPIETAPKDGTAVLVYGWVSGRRSRIIAMAWWVKNEYSRMEVVRVDYDSARNVVAEHRALVGKEGGYWAFETNEGHGVQEPTHWMPLPAPPTDSK